MLSIFSVNNFISRLFFLVIAIFALQPLATYSQMFPKTWINGENCTKEVKGQVHKYNDNLILIRQSVCTNFEAPFIYLLFGKNKVLMLDSGASDFGQRQLVDNIIEQWKIRNSIDTVELIVSHSHGHGDHVAGDNLFKDRPNTQIIAKDVESVKRYFGFKDWPNGIHKLNLGERRVDILPLPGHQNAHIALYDYETQILFTGDSLYPGRIYFKQENFKTFTRSMQKLYKYAQTKEVKHILGTHIEMTNQHGIDYPFEAKAHKNERRLQLKMRHLKQLINWLPNVTTPVTKKVFDDFILFPTN